MTTHVNGANRVADRILATLRVAVPVQLARMREAYALTTRELPDPKLWAAQERVIESRNDMPSVLVGVQRMTRFDIVGEIATPPGAVDPRTGRIYRATYEARVIVDCTDEDWDATALMRDRFEAAVRFGLLAHLDLDDPELIGGVKRCQVLPQSMTAGYYVDPDPTRWRTYRSGALSFLVQHLEPEDLEPVGLVETVTTTTNVVSLNVALPTS